jgi:PST family polysaccharide transporter
MSSPVFRNFVSLATIQGANLLAPLLTLPYLARMIGFEGLGILATAAATCAWLGILIDWGFNLTATRAVATRSHDVEEVARIVSAVTAAKVVLMLLSAAVLAVLLAAVPSVRQYGAVYVFSFAFVVAQAMLPAWAFQGMQRMGSVAAINAAAKLVSAALVLLLVQDSDQFARVPLINAVVSLIAAAMAMRQLRTRLGVRIGRPTWTEMGQMLRGGREIFVATAAGNIYSQGPVLILNLFTDVASVGKYSIAQKISMAAVSIFQSLSQAYFPHISQLWVEAPGCFLRLVRRYIGATQLASAALMGTLFAIAPLVYLLLTGARDAAGIEAIRFWLVVAQLTVLAVMLNPVLVSLGRDRDMARMYIGCSLAFVAYSSVLTQLFLLRGMLMSMVIVEATICLASVASFARGRRDRALGAA